MNLVIGNSAGVFSGLTCQLAWMLVAENPNNELNLQLHTINKTSAWGNHFLDYEPSGRTYLESSSCDNYEEVLGENVLLKFFKEQQDNCGSPGKRGDYPKKNQFIFSIQTI